MQIDHAIVPADAVDEAKTYVRVEHDDEDALIASLIAVAIQHGEGFTATQFLMRGVTERMPVSSAWQRLGMTPVQNITGVNAIADDGTPSPLPVSAYALDIDRNGDGWVRVTAPVSAKRIEVTYSAGIAADWGSLPDALRHGALRLAAHLHAVRDTPDDAGPPAAVAALWRPWRRMRLI
jgi:uncharacterized phiE125 gp8 family phage protein